jgi:hypothetical protein
MRIPEGLIRKTEIREGALRGIVAQLDVYGLRMTTLVCSSSDRKIKPYGFEELDGI